MMTEKEYFKRQVRDEQERHIDGFDLFVAFHPKDQEITCDAKSFFSVHLEMSAKYNFGNEVKSFYMKSLRTVKDCFTTRDLNMFQFLKPS